MNGRTGSAYPEDRQHRDAWILQRRGARNVVDPFVPYAFLVENEHFDNGEVGPVATIFLTNRECPWRCAMCDLWKNTTATSVPAGAIPRQIEHALARLPRARQIKLYNSGSFFDPRAIAPAEYAAIASLTRHHERVIVESHPALLQQSFLHFQQLLGTKLEVAMGLETVHPAVLDKLNKRMTLDQYKDAAEKLAAKDVALRSFVLVQPPFMDPGESLHWAGRSIEFAFACSATAVTLIPTRGGNGAMELLASIGEFATPTLETCEDALDYGVSLCKGRVFLDTWDMDRVSAPMCCRAQRLRRIETINLTQHVSERIVCVHQHG